MTGNAVIIETASHAGLYCIGVDTDQWETVPEAHPCLISSAMKLYGPSLYDLIQTYWQKNPPMGEYYGSVGLAPFHGFESVIPQSVKDRLTEIATALKNRSLSTGHTP